MTATLAPPDLRVGWHDVECAGYTADLPLWRELHAAHPGPVLDVGAGTGRVALDLARAGAEVTALDVDPLLLAALRARAAAGRLHVATACADARGFSLLPTRFALVLVPMQTLQLLPAARDRAAFLARARAHLAPGGRLAVTLAGVLEPFGADHPFLPPPDTGEHEGWELASQPLALRLAPGRAIVERVRRATPPGGGPPVEQPDRVVLALVPPAALLAEGAAAGLRPLGVRAIPPTGDHVGSEVVMWGG
jgi:SAM-dependent methyltransferase